MPYRLVLQVVQKVQILRVRQAAVEMVLGLGGIDGQTLLETAPGLLGVPGVHRQDPRKVQKRLVLREGYQRPFDPRIQLGQLVLERQGDYEIVRLAARRIAQERAFDVLHDDRDVRRLLLGQTRVDDCQRIFKVGLVLLQSLFRKAESQGGVAIAQGVFVQLVIDFSLGHVH